MTWVDSINNFTAFLTIEKSLSHNSVIAYSEDVNKLVTFIKQKDDKITPEKVTKEDMDSADEILDKEIEVYSNYLSGNVCEFFIRDEEDEDIEMHGPFYCNDPEKAFREGLDKDVEKIMLKEGIFDEIIFK